MREDADHVLYRLRRKVAKERARFCKIHAATTDSLSLERTFGEINVCDTILGMIDAERAKFGPRPPTVRKKP